MISSLPLPATMFSRRRAQVVGQGGAQPALGRVGIVIVVAEIAQRGGHAGRWPVGVFVAVEPDYLLQGDAGFLRQGFAGGDALVGFEAADVRQQQIFYVSHRSSPLAGVRS